VLQAIDTCGDDSVDYALCNHDGLGDTVSPLRAVLAKHRTGEKEQG